MTMICPRDRVPLEPSVKQPDKLRCPMCKKVGLPSVWEHKQPNAKLGKRKKGKQPPAPPPDITVLGPNYKVGIRLALDKVLAAARDRELATEEIFAMVADKRDGELGNLRIDQFDPKPLERIADILQRVLLTQELAKLLEIEPWTQRILMQHLIARLLPLPLHPNRNNG